MSNPSLEEKINNIINSEEINDIATKYLPEIYSDEYFFISYSHLDYKDVYCDLLKLQEEGFKIWYDRQMVPGKSWVDIAKRYMTPFDCKGIIFYISENSLKSQAVIEEIKYARDLNKPLITIILPFTNDYLYEGESVKGKCYSANKMLEILKSNGVDIPRFEEKVSFINQYFPEDVIYLTIDMEASRKVELIKNSTLEIDIIESVVKQDKKVLKNAKVTCLTRINDSSVVDIDLSNRNYEAVEISDACFANCNFLEKVKIPYIHQVGEYAFFNCKNLTLLETSKRPPSLFNTFRVGTKGFYNCKKLKEFSQPLNFKDQFGNEYELPRNLCYLGGEETFYHCESLEDVAVLFSIPAHSFTGCKSLKKVNLGRVKGYTFKGEYTAIPGIIGEGAFLDCSSLPEIDLRWVKIIQKTAFDGCSALQKVVFSDELEAIENFAFFGCDALKEITIPKNVTSIGLSAFHNTNYFVLKGENKGIETIYWNAINCKTPDKESVFASNVKKVVIGEDVEILPNYFLCGSCEEMTSLTMNDKLKEIGVYAFFCSRELKEIVLPKSLVKIAKGAFEDSGLETIIYKGSEEDWKKIIIEEKNDVFYNKPIKFME